MRKFPLALLVTLMSIGIVFTACKSSGMKDQILGKWKIDEMHIEYYLQQQQYGEKQMKTLQDSLGMVTDTAKIKMFNAQIAQIQNQLQAFQSSRDSALKKNSWEFQADGNFIATENDGPRKGLWSYDDKLGMLFTVIENQTSSVKVKFNKDTMVLQLDSVNYMKFTPIKGE
ncbi:MAG TPA: hypothetical protein PLD84_01300 [Chitinophagales bacterium]|nr:hypothetical protein [Chitinophagales bacterium]